MTYKILFESATFGSIPFINGFDRVKSFYLFKKEDVECQVSCTGGNTYRVLHVTPILVVRDPSRYTSVTTERKTVGGRPRRNPNISPPRCNLVYFYFGCRQYEYPLLTITLDLLGDRSDGRYITLY